MTLVQFFVNFLRPYKDLPEFTTCVLKALEKLGYPLQGLHSEIGTIPGKRWNDLDVCSE